MTEKPSSYEKEAELRSKLMREITDGTILERLHKDDLDDREFKLLKDTLADLRRLHGAQGSAAGNTIDEAQLLVDKKIDEMMTPPDAGPHGIHPIDEGEDVSLEEVDAAIDAIRKNEPKE